MQLRLQQHIPALKSILATLYSERCGTEVLFEKWFDELTKKICELAAQRHTDLLALDEKRLQDSDWFLHQDMLGYCTYVDRFAGDLKGVQHRIPHLKKLGVRYLHLLPFLKARAGENDGGFAVSSFEEIEPRLGSLADLEELTAALRGAQISLCSDLVLNHVADDHAWANAAKTGSPKYQAYFHSFEDRRLPDQYEAHLG
jgi:amylosucrase